MKMRVLLVVAALTVGILCAFGLPGKQAVSAGSFGMMHVAVNGMAPDPGEHDYPYDTNELIAPAKGLKM